MDLRDQALSILWELNEDLMKNTRIKETMETFSHFLQQPKYARQVWKIHSTQSQHISCSHQHIFVARDQHPWIEIELPYPMQ